MPKRVIDNVEKPTALDRLVRILTAVKNYFTSADNILLALCLSACAFGLMMIYSATRSYSNPGNYIFVHSMAMGIGLLLYFIFSLIDIEFVSERWKLLMLFNILFISTLFIWGVEGDTGNKNWLRIQGLGIGIQPAEIVKVSFIVLLAKQISWLNGTRNGINAIGSVLSLVGHFIMIFGLILVSSRDLGTGLVYLAIFLVMLFGSGLKVYWFLLGGAILGALSPTIWSSFLNDNQRNRILGPYFPDIIDPSGVGINWQANQSKLALASGKLFGQGYLQGTQSQSSNLPFKHTDFIFSVVGEELGLVGCIAVIVLLLLIIVRCIYVGVQSKSRMKFAICLGISSMIAFQAFENIGMCIGLTPVVGITLPFFSYGGSSILTVTASLGVVSGIRRHS
ncbi:MAG: FtsW/RodA/SpoVE family cell cycle protein [Oscillospiraceae bacterium]|nr:FtsW/RodA/SpoVE family cell cycle protein [Oscillospiraceae bacterium]